MDNPEKLATLGTHDAGRRKTHHSTQTTGRKDKPNIFLCGNRNNNKYTVYM
jgi:hypothetical protein